MGKNKKRQKINIPGAKPKPPIPLDVKVIEAKHPHDEPKQGLPEEKPAVEAIREPSAPLANSNLQESPEIKDAEIIEIEPAPSPTPPSAWENFDIWRRKTGLLPVNTKDPNRDPDTGILLPGGASLNPSGRPKGSLNQATRVRQSLERIAIANGIDPEDIEDDIINRGIREARKNEGDFRFWKEMMDRILGKTTDKVAMDVTSAGLPITASRITFVDFGGKGDE